MLNRFFHFLEEIVNEFSAPAVLFALSGAVLAIANAKHDKKATDVRAEHAEEKAWAEAERDAEGALRAEEDAATLEILEERDDYVGRVQDDGKDE